MNRRSLLKLGGTAAIGAVAAPFIPATPKPVDPTTTFTVKVNGDDEVVKAFLRDYENNGKARQIIAGNSFKLGKIL
jgi:hypothetical protein